EVLAEFATQGVDGSGYGVPVGVPQLVILKEGDTVAHGDVGPGSTSATATGSNGGSYTSGENGGGEDGEGNGAEQRRNRNRISRGRAPEGEGDLYGGFGGSGGGNGYGHGPGLRHGGAPSSFMDLVEQSVQRSLLEEEGNPQKSYTSLARI